jgi:hypothetical protein
MPQPQSVEGTLGNVDMDICIDNALGKAFYTIGRPSVRVSCQVECTADNLSKIPMPSMHYLKREISLSKACMARCTAVLSIRLSALSHSCMGIQPHGHARPTLTDESASMRPPLSLTRERASRPA